MTSVYNSAHQMPHKMRARRIGSMPVERIHQSDIKDTLSPIWHTKADVARKALNRLNIVLRYAAAKGLDVDLQDDQS